MRRLTTRASLGTATYHGPSYHSTHYGLTYLSAHSCVNCDA